MSVIPLAFAASLMRRLNSSLKRKSMLADFIWPLETRNIIAWLLVECSVQFLYTAFEYRYPFADDYNDHQPYGRDGS